MRKVLLECNIAIYCHKNIVLSLRPPQEIAVLNAGPASLRDRDNLMAFNLIGQSTIDTLVEEKFHEATGNMRVFASSRKAITCSRVTVGNPSRKSSMVCPPSKYSMRVWTGTRVSRNTGVPPRISGLEVMSE
ncbi:protein of unknown function [Nitrospira japonica]|uniref:Uncharacterized protein n=1 Tax=Nitrospira japonica TaxID=1325564 RepID=A0A1W1I8Q5_9BACT|nr:protein of unknown function [Nitrospira japonica]